MIRAIPPIAPLQQVTSAQQAPSTDRAAGGNFAAQLNEALNEVNALQLKADDMATKLALGQIDDIHQVTIAMEKATLSLQLAVQVRNRMVEAYQEIARMQV